MSDMLRLCLFTTVVAVIFVSSPERKAEPSLAALTGSAASAASALEAVARTSPGTALETARLAEAARQMAHERLAQARQVLAPPARP